MSLSKIDRRACEILLSAARRKVTVSTFSYALHQERIYKRTWLPLFEALGLIFLPVVPGSEQRCVTFKADNVVSFVPPRPAPHAKPSEATG